MYMSSSIKLSHTSSLYLECFQYLPIDWTNRKKNINFIKCEITALNITYKFSINMASFHYIKWLFCPSWFIGASWLAILRSKRGIISMELNLPRDGQIHNTGSLLVSLFQLHKKGALALDRQRRFVYIYLWIGELPEMLGAWGRS